MRPQTEPGTGLTHVVPRSGTRHWYGLFHTFNFIPLNFSSEAGRVGKLSHCKNQSNQVSPNLKFYKRNSFTLHQEFDFLIDGETLLSRLCLFINDVLLKNSPINSIVLVR